MADASSLDIMAQCGHVGGAGKLHLSVANKMLRLIMFNLIMYLDNHVCRVELAIDRT